MSGHFAKIDLLLHDIQTASEPGTPIRVLADEAHAEIHDLAALLSDNPEIRATVIGH